MATEQQVASTVLAAINAALPTSVRAYEPSKVPATRPGEYAVVTVVRRGGGSARAGRHGTKGWSVYIMAASRSSETNARNTLQRAGDAIESAVLSVAGVESTPIRFDNARAVAPDDGWFTGVKTYTFAL